MKDDQPYNEEEHQQKLLMTCNNLSDSVISVAPMLDVTNSHFRMLCRIISEKTELWTEMVVDDTIIHCYNDENRRSILQDVHFKKNDVESPLVLQLGGNHPQKMEKAIEIASKYGFQNFNLNVGCPSCKVASKGSFGASLFKNPLRVAKIVDTCNKKLIDLGFVNKRISVKTRVGVDQYDTYQHLFNFISLVSGCNINNQNKKDYSSIFPQSDDDYDQNILESIDYTENQFIGANVFIIHARKAWLNGINPSKNRTIPKLKYYWVYMLTLDFPNLTFILNGGVTSIKECVSILTGDWYIQWYLSCKDHVKDHQTEINDHMKSKKIRTDRLIDDHHIETPSSDFTLTQEYQNLFQIIQSGKWVNKIKGVMIGREVMNNPFILSKVDSIIYGVQYNQVNDKSSGNNARSYLTRRIVLERYVEYLSEFKPRNIKGQGQFTIGELNMYLKPVFGLFHGFSGTKFWRRTLSEFIQKSLKKEDNILNINSPADILIQSMNLFSKNYSNLLDSTV
ncbi:Dihydrouridine synthase (Dus) family protein [Cryptosporidium meleagridis]|uniref:Dihydrouridine synthase (Dus) family protein n=1 Tax=Cryptosporidium meleagridis TaxID=93969 RepID=A0A2P4YZ99_9CRYT|nr:Dihydrouridine synthase (Dus) family protein [Cryptosporidium meleagridis]